MSDFMSSPKYLEVKRQQKNAKYGEL